MLVWVCHDGEISASVMFVICIFKGDGGVSVMCAILGCAAQVCLLAAVLCGSLVTDAGFLSFTVILRALCSVARGSQNSFLSSLCIN